MDFVTPLYQTLQAQANLEHTQATAQDTRALAQMRQMAVLQQVMANQRMSDARNYMLTGQMPGGAANTNPTGGPLAPSPQGQVPAQGSPQDQTQAPVISRDSPAAYDYPGPIFDSLKGAKKDLDYAEQGIMTARIAQDPKLFETAVQRRSEAQKEYRTAQIDALKEGERRSKELGQVFGMVTNADDLKNAMLYAQANFPPSQVRGISQHIASTLPDPANATPEQIQSAVQPIGARFTAMGAQLRFMASGQASQDRIDRLNFQKDQAEKKAAAAQAGGMDEQLSDGGRAVLAEMTRKGLSIPGGMGSKGTALRIAALNQIASDLDAQGLPPNAVSQQRLDYRTQQQVQNDFTKGPTSRNITSINTSLGHLQTLQDLGRALNSGDVQLINRVVNAVSNQFGDPAINNAQTAAQAVGEEMMRTFRVVGASVTEAEKWEQKFNQALQSPAQMTGVIKTGADLLRSRLEAVDDQWKRGMKVDSGFPNIISPKNQEFLDSIGVKYKVTRPAGQQTAGAVPAAAQNSTTGGGGCTTPFPAPPPSAILHLKAHPETANDFREIFGYVPQ